jgi:hypothetical protein
MGKKGIEMCSDVWLDLLLNTNSIYYGLSYNEQIKSANKRGGIGPEPEISGFI